MKSRARRLSAWIVCAWLAVGNADVVGQEKKAPEKKAAAPPSTTSNIAPKVLRAVDDLVWAAGTLLPKPAPVPKPVGPRLVVAERRLNADANFIQQIEQAYGAQFRQLMLSELHFMRVVTDPTRAQYEKIKIAAEPSIKSALELYAQSMRGGSVTEVEVSKPICDAIAASVRATLAPERAAEYQKEIALRTAARRRTAVANLVVMIDNILYLRSDQREKLIDILANNWNESWNQQQLFLMNGQYFPPLPENEIRPLLTESQFVTWNGIQKRTIRFGLNIQIQRGVGAADDDWDDEAPKERPNAAAKKSAPAEASKKP